MVRPPPYGGLTHRGLAAYLYSVAVKVKRPKATRTTGRRRGRTRISTKNQVTLPVDALRRSGLGTGDELRVEVEGPGRLALVRDEDPLARLAGTFRYPKDYLKKLRAEWRY